jgi:hypothetical protein
LPPSSASTTSSPAARAARPEQLPETYWDAAASAVKPEFWQSYQELATRDAAEQIRRQTLPKAPDYKPELPKDFVLPQGMQWEWKTDAPELAKFREFAAESGLSQDQFSKALGLYAGMQVAEQASFAELQRKDFEKLGANADVRKAAVSTFLNGILGPELGRALGLAMYSADAVKAMEMLVSKFSSQGVASFRQDGREPGAAPGRVTEEAYSRMSAAERWAYAKSFPQDQFRNGGGR